jgi:hypothetical protein
MGYKKSTSKTVAIILSPGEVLTRAVKHGHTGTDEDMGMP